MEPFVEAVWAAGKQAGPFGVLLSIIWGWTQYRRAEFERAEREKLHSLVYGDGGLVDRTIKALNDATVAVQAVNETARPIFNAVIERVLPGDRGFPK